MTVDLPAFGEEPASSPTIGCVSCSFIEKCVLSIILRLVHVCIYVCYTTEFSRYSIPHILEQQYHVWYYMSHRFSAHVNRRTRAIVSGGFALAWRLATAAHVPRRVESWFHARAEVRYLVTMVTTDKHVTF